MTRPEFGSKHVCPKCTIKFYDMNKSPCVCPKCATVVDLVRKSPPRASKVETEVVDDLEKVGGGTADFVSLDDADRESGQIGKVAVDIDDDEFEIDDSALDDQDDAALLEEEDDDVSGLLSGGLADDDHDEEV